jgi:hypothetical protein
MHKLAITNEKFNLQNEWFFNHEMSAGWDIAAFALHASAASADARFFMQTACKDHKGMPMH